MAIDICVENFSGAILKALAASTTKCRPSDDTRHLIPASILDEMRLKNRLRRQWQATSNPALKAENNRLQRSVTSRLNEWRNDQWSATLESLDPEDQSLWRMTKRVNGVPTPSARGPPGESLSQTLRKPKPLPTIWRLFHTATDPLDPAVIEMGDVALRCYSKAPAREPKLTNPEEVHEDIRGLKISKVPGPNVITNRALKYLPQRAVSLLVRFAKPSPSPIKSLQRGGTLQ